MNITCPQCHFSRTVDPARIPARTVKVNCPKCGASFSFDRPQQSTLRPDPPPWQTPVAKISCPACGLVQEQGEECRGCGVIFAKLRGQEAAGGRTPLGDPMYDHLAELRRQASSPTAWHQPKAGFWLRAVAYLIDFCLLSVMQFVLSLLIGMIIGMLGLGVADDPATSVVLWLFGASLSIGYAVFFTGYCGQTPGKMALRIKVIRCDGSQISYGRAALREVPGKIISALLLGIGYLMVAFDSQKQGLHDKIADTYVVKL